MSPVTRIQLLPGVFLTAVHTKKFKSSLLSVSLLSPLTAEDAAANALIPFVLRRGSQAHPDMQSISAALDRLYGGDFVASVRKKGETQCVGFIGSFLDDAYVPDHSGVLEKAAELMGELLLRPYTQDGAFCPDYTAGEKANLIDRIRAEVNDKRQYAVTRVVEEMCKGEAYGVNRYGSEAAVAAITPQSLWARYQDLLSHARVELYYCGSAEVNHVCVILQRVLGGLPREGKFPDPRCAVIPACAAPHRVEEVLDVAQGKLTMGFRTGGVTAGSPEYPAMILCNAVFGGSTMSKLFMNVREKLSLCYYASSQLRKEKGLMIVSSGVEFAHVKQAEDEILAQLDACRRGRYDDAELNGARRSVVSALRAMTDSQSAMENYWLGQAVEGGSEDVEDLAQRVEAVTADEVAACANKLSLDTVYFLKGMEA